jgi:hypothetical protein
MSIKKFITAAYLKKLIAAQLVNNFPAFYKNRRFIAAFTNSSPLEQVEYALFLGDTPTQNW